MAIVLELSAFDPQCLSCLDDLLALYKAPAYGGSSPHRTSPLKSITLFIVGLILEVDRLVNRTITEIERTKITDLWIYSCPSLIAVPSLIFHQFCFKGRLRRPSLYLNRKPHDESGYAGRQQQQLMLKLADVLLVVCGASGGIGQVGICVILCDSDTSKLTMSTAIVPFAQDQSVDRRALPFRRRGNPWCYSRLVAHLFRRCSHHFYKSKIENRLTQDSESHRVFGEGQWIEESINKC